MAACLSIVATAATAVADVADVTDVADEAATLPQLSAGDRKFLRLSLPICSVTLLASVVALLEFDRDFRFDDFFASRRCLANAALLADNSLRFRLLADDEPLSLLSFRDFLLSVPLFLFAAIVENAFNWVCRHSFTAN